MGGTATFDYAVNGTGLAPFTRDTAVANPTTSAPFAFSGLQLGTKDVQETPEAGWTLTNIVCTANGAEITIGTGIGGTFAQGATAGFDPGDTTVRAVITAGDAPTCTYTNTAGCHARHREVAAWAALRPSTTRSTARAWRPSPRHRGRQPHDQRPLHLQRPPARHQERPGDAQAGWTLTNIVCTANGAEITIGTGIGGTFVQGATAGFDPGDTTVRAVITAGDNADLHVHEHQTGRARSS